MSISFLSATIDICLPTIFSKQWSYRRWGQKLYGEKGANTRVNKMEPLYYFWISRSNQLCFWLHFELKGRKQKNRKERENSSFNLEFGILEELKILFPGKVLSSFCREVSYHPNQRSHIILITYISISCIQNLLPVIMGLSSGMIDYWFSIIAMHVVTWGKIKLVGATNFLSLVLFLLGWCFFFDRIEKVFKLNTE